MRQILLYGLVLGVLLLFMQYFKYRLVFIQHAESVYTGLVAAVCCVAGIWAGQKLAQRWGKKTEAVLVQPSVVNTIFPNEKSATEWGLTSREFEVLQCIAAGLSNQEIAEKLFLSLNTVKTHTSNLFAKLDVQRRTQAVQKAKELGII